MKLQQLRYLIAIVDNELNITAAAERMYTSQPGVSKQLKLLEQELGVILFRRKGKSLDSITTEGEEVVERARVVARQIEAIKSVGANRYEETVGELSIATTHTQARYVLPAIVKEFKQRFPQIHLNIHQGTSEQIASLMNAGEVDFAIASDSQQMFNEILFIPCFQWDRIVVVPKDHALASLAGELTLSELAKYPLVTYVFSLTGESSLKRSFAEEGYSPDVVFTARDADVIKTYVRMGMGVGIVASMAFEEADQDDLVVVDSAALFPRSTTWIGYRNDAALTRYMLEFIQLLIPQLGQYSSKRIADAESQPDIDRLIENCGIPLQKATVR